MIDADELKWLGEPLHVAAYRKGANGQSAAAIGLAAALARGAGKPASSTVRTTATTTATAKPKASTNPARSRIQIVADAVANDPACKGKAALAIQMLASDDYASVTGTGIVTLLRAGASAPTAQNVADARDKAMRAEMHAAINSTGNSAISPDGGGSGSQARDPWASTIARMNGTKPAPLQASKAASGAWDNVIAKMNRANGFTA